MWGAAVALMELAAVGIVAIVWLQAVASAHQPGKRTGSRDRVHVRCYSLSTVIITFSSIHSRISKAPYFSFKLASNPSMARSNSSGS